jgi:hypothetical protein
MKLARIAAWLLGFGVLVGASAFLSAEEITLKDGTKIVGTIVGYEKDMFRVETDFGVALIRKDKVVSIQVSKPGSATLASPAPVPNSIKPIEPKPAASAPVASAPTPVPKPQVVLAPPALVQIPSPLLKSAEAPAVIKPADPTPIAARPLPPPLPPKPPAPPPPPPPPVSHPIDVPLPAHLEEHLDENTYFSDTFHFSMYKPPDWKIFEGVPKETGSGIMAMGTDDEQTILIVDRQVWSGTPKLSGDEVDAKFRQTYQDYRQLSQESIECDGQTATRRTFTGVLDGVEWHGVAVHVIRGNSVFGITGVTSAETFGFQEAIFNKVAKSFHFLTSAEQANGGTAKP